MIPQNTSRPSVQAIELGPQHGYRIEQDQAFINAELQVPPHHPGGEWRLELWASDHPHVDSTFPNSQRVLAEQTAHLATDVRDDIVWRNCARLYGLDITERAG